MRRGMVGSFDVFGHFGIEGGAERVGRGTVPRRGGLGRGHRDRLG
jgi:hypothetical protein